VKKSIAISIFVSIAFLVMLTFPLINLANRGNIILGIPALVLYIFTLWAILVGVMGWLSKNDKTPEP
jgi:hypothetical protein